MSTKQFAHALFRWSVLAGLVVAAFWGIWRLAAGTMLPYLLVDSGRELTGTIHPRVWWADALLTTTLVNVIGWIVWLDGEHYWPAEHEQRVLKVLGPTLVVLGGLIGIPTGAFVGVCMFAALGWISAFFGTLLGAACGGFTGTICGGLLAVQAARLLVRVYAFLCARKYE